MPEGLFLSFSQVGPCPAGRAISAQAWILGSVGFRVANSHRDLISLGYSDEKVDSGVPGTLKVPFDMLWDDTKGSLCSGIV